MYKRLFIMAMAIAYGAFCAGIPSAHALNEDMWIGLCNPCSTTSEFETAATNLVYDSEKWSGQPYNTTYTVTAIMSNLSSSTAFIHVSGYWTPSGRAGVVFVPQSSIPVDASGNSLAGESEAYLENYYTQVDWYVYSVSRSSPLAIGLFGDGTVAQDFTGVPDTAISISIAITLGFDPPANSPIQVQFADSVIATFIRTTNTNVNDKAHWWVWGNIAHNLSSVCVEVPGTTKTVCGAPIDHNGHVIINTNTSGKSGGSAKPNPAYYIYPTPVPPSSGTSFCTFSSYVTDPDGDSFGGTGYGPC